MSAFKELCALQLALMGWRHVKYTMTSHGKCIAVWQHPLWGEMHIK